LSFGIQPRAWRCPEGMGIEVDLTIPDARVHVHVHVQTAAVFAKFAIG
jgi:hypothetical protein